MGVKVRLDVCRRCHAPNLVPSGVDGNGRLVCHRCCGSLRPWTQSLHNNRLAAILAGAALVLYLPAMILPVMGIRQFGLTNEVGLVEGVVALMREGNALLGLILLSCSVFLPLAKIVALLLLSTRGPRIGASRRSHLFHLLEWTGRFSFLDVLLVAVLIAVVKVGDLVTVYMGSGLVAFTAVVFFTLMATWAFDSDTIWSEVDGRKRVKG
jgi:paraquat-inducible protein A